MATPQEKNLFIKHATYLIQNLQMTPIAGANIDLSNSNIRALFSPEDICLSASDKMGNSAFISSLGLNHSQEAMERFRNGYNRLGVQYEAGGLLSGGVDKSISEVTESLSEYFATNFKIDFLSSMDSVAMTNYYHRSMAVKNFLQQCRQFLGFEGIAVNCFSTVSRTSSGNWGISSFICVSIGDLVLNVEYSQDGVLNRIVPVHTEEQINAASAIAVGATRLLDDDEECTLWDNLAPHEKNHIRNKVMQVLINPKITSKALHETWVRSMEAAGWRFGGGKDGLSLKLHPHMVSFEKLSRVDQIKNDMFISGAIAGLKLQNLLV